MCLLQKSGYRDEDRIKLEAFRLECEEAVDTAKRDYVRKLGNRLNDSSSFSKSYWKIIKRVMNKSC